ncbi:MAG: nucleotidyl transferase AbiEii/AbiGii toxin family protein [Planctomycetes bacterium]|nr:nucleotidyl transferase AbiEii/AbiGii toxin family protein [Planctomycetota bacterium]
MLRAELANFEAARAIDKARVAKQIDVGFGDIVTRRAESLRDPTRLEFAAPELWGDPREPLIAEKFHARVDPRTRNSRRKDFYDAWLLFRPHAFEGAPLANAISTTDAWSSSCTAWLRR